MTKTDEAYLFLCKMGEEVKTQDNAITSHPIFYVLQERQIFGLSMDYTDESIYVRKDDGDYDAISATERAENYATYMRETLDDSSADVVTARDVLRDAKAAYDAASLESVEVRADLDAAVIEAQKALSDAEDVAASAADDLMDEEEYCEDQYNQIGYKTIEERVQPFFTRKAAELYLASNRHNLRNPSVYVGSGYRNDEWQAIRAMLSGLNLTQVLLNEIVSEERAAALLPPPPTPVVHLWVLEHRKATTNNCGDVSNILDCTVWGVFSSEEKALTMARAHLDSLDDNVSWFYIGVDELDVDFDDGCYHERIPPTCMDRTGKISKEFQPSSAPHLL